MSIIEPELEYVDRGIQSIRYLEHGWPTKLCRWHSHAEYELHFVAETHGKAFIGDHIGEFEPGSLFLTGPYLPHNWITDEYTNPTPVDVRDMLVQFSQENIDQLTKAFPEFREFVPLLELAKSGIEFTGFSPDMARTHLKRIRDAKGVERIVSFLRFLYRLNEHAEKRPLSVAGMVHPEGNTKQARIAEVVDYISGNFAENISLEIVAKMAGMSTTSFSRNFQIVAGNRFTEFVNRVRISQACSLLYSTDKQISTICFDVGFQNLANFNRQFLKMKGLTPKEYREIAVKGLVSDSLELQ